jgi:hypothetical protein
MSKKVKDKPKRKTITFENILEKIKELELIYNLSIGLNKSQIDKLKSALPDIIKH